MRKIVQDFAGDAGSDEQPIAELIRDPFREASSDECYATRKETLAAREPRTSGLRDDVCRIIANGCISDPHSVRHVSPRALVALIWRLLYSALRLSRVSARRASITRNNIFL